MSTLSKIFVVFNFLVALSFMIASLTLYSKKVNWVDEARKNVEQRNKLKNDILNLQNMFDKSDEKLKKEISEKNTELGKLRTEKTDFLKQNSELLGQNTELRTANSKHADNVANHLKRISELEQKDVKQLAELKAVRAERDKSVLSRQFAETQAIETMADLKESEAELMQLAKKNHKMMTEIMQQSILLDKARQAGFGETITASMANITPVNGRVLQVELAVGIVILNVGEKDKVKKGMEFVISRGSKYVGKVRIRNVYPDMCSAVILRDVTPETIEIADIAQTM